MDWNTRKTEPQRYTTKENDTTAAYTYRVAQGRPVSTTAQHRFKSISTTDYYRCCAFVIMRCSLSHFHNTIIIILATADIELFAWDDYRCSATEKCRPPKVETSPEGSWSTLIFAYADSIPRLLPSCFVLNRSTPSKTCCEPDRNCYEPTTAIWIETE